MHASPGAESALEAREARIALAVIAAVGLALLAMAAGPHRIGDYFTETDFYGAYAEGARLIQQGHFVPARYGVVGPGYEAALALLGFALRDLFQAAETLSLLSTVAALLLWFDLLRRRAGSRIALVALLIMALNPFVFRYGYAASTDAFSLALVSLALWLLLARAGAAARVGAGLVTGLAFLTRYNALVLLPASWIVIWRGGAGGARQTPAGCVTGEAPGRRVRAVDALLFTAGFLAPVVPWVLYSLAHGGGFSFQLHHNIAYEVFARSRGMVWDEYQKTLQPQFHNLWDVIRRDPRAVFARMAFNVFDHLRLDGLRLLGWPVGLAAIAGALLLPGERAAAGRTLGRALAPVLLAGALLFLSVVPAFYSERYSLPLVPVYAALAGVAFGSPRFAFALKRPAGVWLKGVLLALVLLASGWQSVRYQLRAVDQLPVEVIEAARTLRSLARPGDRVIARKPHLAFHSGLEPAPFPFTETIPELASAARAGHARWLFVSWPEVETRPSYWHLLDTTGVVPGLTVRHVTAPHPSVLYEIGPGFGTVPAWYANDTTRAWHTARAQTLVTPRDAKAWFTIGLVETHRGALDSARVHLERALALDPRYLHAMLILGEVHLLENDVAGAREAYSRAIALDPGSVDAQIGLGWAYLLEGRTAEAAARWRPLVDRTQDPETLSRMIQLFASTGDREGAVAAAARLRALAGPR